MRSKVFGFMPYPMEVLIGWLTYRNFSATLYGQGTTRFSGEEITLFRKQIFESFNAMLVDSKRKSTKGVTSDDPFWLLGGVEPTEVDSVLYGFVCSALVCKA